MQINLSKDSVVDQRTGVVNTPNEYVENLRALELQVQRLDDSIAAARADLKVMKENREKAVADLRSSIREGKVLPLLESEGEHEDDGDKAN